MTCEELRPCQRYGVSALVAPFLAVALASCAREPQIEFVELTPEQAEIYFILVDHLDDQELQPQGPYGELFSEKDPSFETPAGDYRVFVYALSAELLARSAPRFDPARIGETRATIDRPLLGCQESVTNPGADSSLLDWPSDAPVFQLSDSRPGSLSLVPFVDSPGAGRIALVVPIDSESCGDDIPAIAVPFGATLALIPAGSSFDQEIYTPRMTDISDLIRIDETRVIALISGNVLLLERGRPLIDDPLHRVRLEPQLPALSVVPYSLAALRGPERTRLFVGGHADRMPRIWELLLSPSGLSFVRTTTTPAAGIKDVVVVPGSERLVALLDDVSVITSSSPGGVFSRRQLPIGLLEGPATRIKIIPSEETPLVVSGKNGVLFVGDPTATNWIAVGNRGMDLGLLFRAIDGFSRPHGTELWLGGSLGSIRKIALPSAVENVTLAAPPSWGPCGDNRLTPCGFLAQPQAFHRFVAWTDPERSGIERLFGFADRCNAGLSIRPSDLCTSLVRLSDQEVVSDRGIEAAHIFEGLLTVGGSSGIVAELDLR